MLLATKNYGKAGVKKKNSQMRFYSNTHYMGIKQQNTSCILILIRQPEPEGQATLHFRNAARPRDLMLALKKINETQTLYPKHNASFRLKLQLKQLAAQ